MQIKSSKEKGIMFIKLRRMASSNWTLVRPKQDLTVLEFPEEWTCAWEVIGLG